MTQNTLDKAKIETNSYNSIFDELNKHTNIKDPRDPNGKRKFIYDFDPFHEGINFSQLPYILFEIGVPEYLGKMSVKGDRKNILFTYNLTVRTAQTGANNSRNVDNGRIEMLNICDDLQEMFNSLTIRQIFINLNLHKFNLTKISTDTLSLEGKYMYESNYELTCMTPYLQVST